MGREKQIKDRKKFKDTGFGKFLNKAKEFIPDVLDIADTVITGGKVGDVIDVVQGKIGERAQHNARAQELLAQLEMHRREWELEWETIHLQDIANARQREVELAKTGQRDYMTYIVGGLVLLVFSFQVLFLAFKTIPEGNEKMFYYLMGIVDTAVVSIVSYYFGSSKGSKDKQQTIDRLKD